MRQAARVVFRLLAVVYLLGAVGAFFAAGVAIFTLNSRATPAGETLTEGSFDQVFGGHLAMGDLLFLVAVLLVMVAFVAGVDGRKRLGAVALLVLAIAPATARDLHDEQNTATSRNQPMSGIEIHASLYDTLVSRRWLVEAPELLQALLLILAGLFLGLFIPRVRARTGALAALFIWIGWLLAAFVSFDRGYILDIVWPTLLIIFSYTALLLERWISTERERRKIRSAFSRYVSANVVEAIMKDIDRLKLGGEAAHHERAVFRYSRIYSLVGRDGAGGIGGIAEYLSQ